MKEHDPLGLNDEKRVQYLLGFFGELQVPVDTEVIDHSPLSLYQRGAARCLQMSRFKVGVPHRIENALPSICGSRRGTLFEPPGA